MMIKLMDRGFAPDAIVLSFVADDGDRSGDELSVVDLAAYSALADSIPHSHSMISGHRKSLNSKGKLFPSVFKNRVMDRQIFPLLIPKGNSRSQFCAVSTTIAIDRSISWHRPYHLKKTVINLGMRERL